MPENTMTYCALCGETIYEGDEEISTDWGTAHERCADVAVWVITNGLTDSDEGVKVTWPEAVCFVACLSVAWGVVWLFFGALT